MDAEFMAKLFHDKYEKSGGVMLLSPLPRHGTKHWFEIPEENRKLLISIARDVLAVQQRQAEDNPTPDHSVVEMAYDVFTRVRRWKMKFIKWVWPDIHRLVDSLYSHWEESPNKRDDLFGPFI